ncbi:MAG: ATP-binding protein [Pseudomonadota bacterium]
MAQNNQKKIDHLVKEYRDFAYATSHDLGASLRSIVGFSEIILEKSEHKLDEETKKYLDIIHKSGLQAQETVTSLLRMSRLNTRQWEIDRVDLNQTVEIVQSELIRTIDRYNAQIECDILPSVAGDKTIVKTVFYELIENSIKFRREDIAPLIKISSHEENDFHIVTLQDNSIGINPRDYERILLPLKKGGFQEKDYGGSGMGLAIVCSIMRRLMGDIKFQQPENGEGNIVQLYFIKDDRICDYL